MQSLVRVENKVVLDYITTLQNLNTPQQRGLITLTSFGSSTNSEWAVKSANLHREYFSSTIRLLVFCLCGPGVGFNDVLKDSNSRPGAYLERAACLLQKTLY